jgi:RNA polymerase sigma factor (TIGR02999 family)
MAEAPGDITLLLDAWGRGERDALHQLAPLVYPHLQRLAASYLRRESNAGVLQATALVNELFVGLLARREARFTDRQHFFALSATLMRMALVDHARRVRSEKRGGGAEMVPLHDELPWVDAAGPGFLDFDRALSDLEHLDPERFQVVNARFVLGCTADETAELLGISRVTVNRRARSARAWLAARLGLAGDTEPSARETAPDQT